MATTQEAIARLRMIFETQGADAAAAEMKKLETSSTSLGTSSLNLDRAFTNLERRYNETARATADYERAMRTLNAAVAQNPALVERAAAVTQTLTAKYQAQMATIEQARTGHTALGVGMQAMAAQATTASASTGILGSMLQTLGKGGTAAAIGIGGIVLVMQKLNEGVHSTAQYARDIQNFADATGLTTAQVQGLNKEASRFGIGADEMRSSLMRFTSTFEEVRGGGGALLEIIRKIDSGLGEQAVSAANEEEALNVVAAAYHKAGDEFERARLLRAAFGRGGQAMGPLMENLDLGKITDKYAGRGLSEDIIKDLRRLEGEIATIGSNTSNKIYSLFAVPWLEAEKAVLKYIEQAAKGAAAAIKGPSAPTSEDIPRLLDQQQKLIENAERLQQLLDQPQGKATFAAMRQEMEKTITDLKLVDAWLEKLQAAKAGGGLTSGEPSFEARAKDAQLLVQTLGDLATVQERVQASTYQLEAAYKQLGAAGKARINEMREPLEARMQVQGEMGEVAPGTYDRQLEQIQKIKAEYPGLVAQDAIRMSMLDDQLRIAQAMPGAARMQAVEQARINQLLLEGKELTLATAIAGKERAIVQAQINAQAQQQLAGLKDQYAVAAAVTGQGRIAAQMQATRRQLIREGVSEELAGAIARQQALNAQAQINAQAKQTLAALKDQLAVAQAITGAERMKAQAAATYAQLVRQGVSGTIAQAIAAQEVANAHARANANVERQIVSLSESTALIRAQMADMEDQAGAAQKILGFNEINVRVAQAYAQAIRDGADEEHAAALAAATLNNLLAQRQMQIEQIAQAEAKAAAAAEAQADAAARNLSIQREQAAAAQNQQATQEARTASAQADAEAASAGQAFNQRMGSAQASAAAGLAQQITSLAQAGSQTAKAFIASGMMVGALNDQPMMGQIIQKAQQEVDNLPRHQRNLQAYDQLRSLQDEYRIGAAATPQEKAQIQAQITYEDLLKQGVSAAVAQQIADQQLANAMQELSKSVDANTTALQAQLDPIYTEGRAALRIGYYGEGSSGTMRTVTGTGYANDNIAARADGGDVYAGRAYRIGERGPELFVPGASGMIVPNNALRGADAAQTGNVIIINNNFPPGSVLGDRRTQYLAANSYGRAIKAVG